MEWASAIEADGCVLLDAARRAPAAPVPACGSWTLTDLAGHLAVIHQRTAYLCRTGSMSRPSQKGGQLEPPPADGVLAWAEGWLGELVAQLRSTPADTPMWSFFEGGGNAGWWARRMAHETLVHRVDAEQAAGRPGSAIDPAMAVDGIDELLDVFLQTFGAPPFGSGETLHLHAADIPGEWLLTLGADAITVERGHAKGDTAVRGDAADLYLWLWGRAPLDRLEVFGAASIADALRGAVARCTS